MDDQTPYPFDPDATQRQPMRDSKASFPTPPNQSQQGQPSRQSQAEWRGASQLRPSAGWQASNPQLNSRQQSELPTRRLVEEIEKTLESRRPRFRRTRRWLRSRSGRIVVPLVALLLGFVVGLCILLWYGWSGEGPIVLIPNSGQGNLIIEAKTDFLTQLVRQNIAKANLPGKVENVNVTLARGDALTVEGDDVYSVFGFNISRHFTVHMQPYVQSCVMQVRVTSANLGGIPVTGFVQSFQSNINQQLATKPAGLPGGFTYCAVGVRTEPGGIFITYNAVATGK